MAQVLDPALVYWVLKMDDIHGFIECLIFLCFMGGLASVMYAITGEHRVHKTGLITSTTLGIALGLVLTFLPSTQQLATVVVLPTIANSKIAFETSGLTLDIIKLARDKVQELTKVEPKKDK